MCSAETVSEKEWIQSLKLDFKLDSPCLYTLILAIITFVFICTSQTSCNLKSLRYHVVWLTQMLETAYVVRLCREIFSIFVTFFPKCHINK